MKEVIIRYDAPNIDLTSALDIATYVRSQMDDTTESLWVFARSATGKAVAYVAAHGDLGQIRLTNGAIFRKAILINPQVSEIFLAHNHPSGDPNPSPEDLSFTDDIRNLGHALGIPIKDHVIVTRTALVSLGG
jgi:DNA repair protein RadC